MIQRRPRLVLALVSVFCVGLAVSSASADGPKPCLKTTYAVAQVKAACDSGGQDAVKKLMKAAVDKAKAAGADTKCVSCHENLKDFALTANAVADLRPLL